ncbi:MAG: MFS transporter [Actinoallomurus sp.]
MTADAGGAGWDPFRRPVFLATAATTLAGSPVFLFGGQAVQIGSDLELSPATLGVTVSLFFTLTALSSAVLGRAVQHTGVRWSLAATMTGSTVALLGLALSRSVVQLALSLALGGLANGAVHPSSNLLLASRSSRTPLGLSLGIKQSAPTAASIGSGLAVPLIALTYGWRWSFVGSAVLSVVLGCMAMRLPARLPGTATPTTVTPDAARGRRLLVMMAVAAGCGSAAGNSLGAFLVDYGVHDVGLAQASAGLAFALASMAGLCGRIVWGWVMDRRWSPRPLPLAIVLLLFGSTGYVLIGTGSPVAYVLGALVAYGFGWAWVTLLHYAVVSRHTDGAARATGVLMTGFAAGGFAGPLLLGQVAQGTGYHVVWFITACCNVVAGAVLWFALRRNGRRP